MTAFGRALIAECRHLRRDRWDLAGLVAVPAALFMLVAAMFWSGAMRDLPVVLVDQDRSAASRAVARAIEDSPRLHIVAVRDSEKAALPDLRSNDALGVIDLPRDLGAGLARHRTPVVRILFNASFLSAGSQVAHAAAEAVQDAAAEVVTAQLSGHALPPRRARRFAVEVIAIGNPATSFEWFLGSLIFPAILHLVAAGVCGMALGRELRDRSLGAWARASGGVLPALIGKMLPYVVVTSLWGAVWLVWLTLARGWRVEGSVMLIMVGQSLFYAATAAIAALLIAATKETATTLSVSAVYAGSAVAYSGATLPLYGASTYARVWSNVLPLPHYIALQMGQVSGLAPAAAIRPLLALAAYVVVAGVLAVRMIARQARAA